jgi:alkylation response protein AidB-like acyl-CoA dehydrogenase
VLPIEGISRVDAGVGVVLAVHASALPTFTYGNEEQKARFVPDLARGEKIGRLA